MLGGERDECRKRERSGGGRGKGGREMGIDRVAMCISLPLRDL